MTREPRSDLGIVGCLVRFDYLLLLFILLTTAFGLVVLYGTTHGVATLENKAPEQAERWAISMVVFFLAVLVPYRWLKSLGWPFYFSIIGLLGLLAFCHDAQNPKSSLSLGGLVMTENGATSWFKIPGLPQIQPSEFAKIAVVIVLSQWLAWRREKLTSFRECLVPFALVALPMGLIVLQPDVGTASFFLPLPIILLFLAGLRWKVILRGLLIGLPLLVALVCFLATVESLPRRFLYVEKRIVPFRESLGETLKPLMNPFNPPSVERVLHGPSPEESDSKPGGGKKKTKNDTYQADKAEMALGSGKIIGNGWGKGKISTWRFLPKHHNDFIFSSLGEQFGLIGCMTLIGLYLLIAWRVLHIALVTPDPFGKYLVVGLVSIVLLQAFVNIAVALRLLPVTGVPLPFVSHGGSFLVTCYLIFGLIANVSMRR